VEREKECRAAVAAMIAIADLPINQLAIWTVEDGLRTVQFRPMV
jgi:hypothetical protein